MLKYFKLRECSLISGKKFTPELSYQLFGCPLHTAPIILVNHALTGNSNVSGENGWWSSLIGPNKTINTKIYTILAFNIPGNGFDGKHENLVKNYKDFTAKDIANIFLMGLKYLEISKLHSIIGGSLGGGIAWEMLVTNPKIAKYLIPIASDWKSSDWIIANCLIQEQFLINSSQPIKDARMHAMLCYRTPDSFEKRFERSKAKGSKLFNIELWLIHHGEKLQKRFQLSAYKLMNQLLKTIDITSFEKDILNLLPSIEAEIHIVGIESDLFFVSKKNIQVIDLVKRFKRNIYYHQINSIHGHDAFLIEYDQLDSILSPIFKKSEI